MKPLLLLLVDDDEDDRDLFVDAVYQIDPEIESVLAENGAEGLNYLQNEANLLPDFIFLDLRMPGMSGRTFLKIVKQDPRLQDIPVMVYTTSRDVSDAEELVAMGAAHFASKPSNPEEIYYLLSVILEEKW